LIFQKFFFHIFHFPIRDIIILNELNDNRILENSIYTGEEEEEDEPVQQIYAI
jgi:hypothetical protein